MSASICSRCAEPQVQPSGNPLKLCAFCAGELTHSAVDQLAAWQGPGDRAKLKRSEAIDGLRQLGCTEEQVLRARARVFDRAKGETLKVYRRGARYLRWDARDLLVRNRSAQKVVREALEAAS